MCAAAEDTKSLPYGNWYGAVNVPMFGIIACKNQVHLDEREREKNEQNEIKKAER